MVFHECYGRYFHVVAEVLEEAVKGRLTHEGLEQLVRKKAFAESVLTIPEALRTGKWPLLTQDMGTPLQHPPSTPFTTLEKRWLKALLLDPRIQLFARSLAGLEEVKPLFTPDLFVYFDRYSDGDPFEDEGYMARFQVILTALREKRRLALVYEGRQGHLQKRVCIPYKLEYSAKDDKFRLLTIGGEKNLTINLGRVRDCQLMEHYPPSNHYFPKPSTKKLVLELVNERNALERAMLHFSHLEKETMRIDKQHYQLTLWYDQGDETEILIRVLSFGPLIRVIAPDSMIRQIKDRLKKQMVADLE